MGHQQPWKPWTSPGLVRGRPPGQFYFLCLFAFYLHQKIKQNKESLNGGVIRLSGSYQQLLVGIYLYVIEGWDLLGTGYEYNPVNCQVVRVMEASLIGRPGRGEVTESV